ncbi:DUF4097 family beta strand repeat-containing protein [Rhizosphaericola mali]|uniref:DUF4097 domain-containing protein n=1 Tax=Rhizosphaericola mali TaxID=2545455 RepID=A0A5P2GBA4_9BACT|nr:hypothetical protein [Rhizosphaericola mali]QES90493.1 DUF4097 domain-containing protein [Rhizosphaericola mali]
MLKKYFPILGLCAIIALPSCIQSSQAENHSFQFFEKYVTETIDTKQFPSNSFTKVNSATPGGNIEVLGDAGAQSSVEVIASSNKYSGAELKQKIAEIYDLNVSVSNGELFAQAKIKSEIKKLSNTHISINFKLHVPNAVSTSLKTSGGNLHLASLRGDQDFATSGGNIAFEDIHGMINGRTSGGNIVFKNVDNTVKVSTSGGNILAENANGNLQLTTSGGNISGENLTGSFDVVTSGGNIALNQLAGKVDGSTSGGQITVSMRQISGDIQLRNSGGGISLTVPKNTAANVQFVGENLDGIKNHMENFSGNLSKKTISGKINGGGNSNINVSSSGGSIQFNQL